MAFGDEENDEQPKSTRSVKSIKDKGNEILGKLSSDLLLFKKGSDGNFSAKFSIDNACQEPLLFKIKVTDIRKYRLVPIFGLIIPKKNATIEAKLNDKDLNFTISKDKLEVSLFKFPEVNDEEVKSQLEKENVKPGQTTTSYKSLKFFWNKFVESRQVETHRINFQVEKSNGEPNIYSKRVWDKHQKPRHGHRQTQNEPKTPVDFKSPPMTPSVASRASPSSSSLPAANTEMSIASSNTSNTTNTSASTATDFTNNEDFSQSRRHERSMFEQEVSTFVMKNLTIIVMYLMAILSYLCLATLWCLYSIPEDFEKAKLERLGDDFDFGYFIST